MVSLRMRSRQAVSSNSAVATWADASVTATRVHAMTTSRLSIEIEGDLNDQERGAIRELLAQAEAIAGQFFAGDLEQAVASGAALQVEASQLAEVDLRMKVRERIDLSTLKRGAADADADAPATPAPAAATTTAPPPEQSPPVLEPAVADWAAAPVTAGRLKLGREIKLQLLHALVDLHREQT